LVRNRRRGPEDSVFSSEKRKLNLMSVFSDHPIKWAIGAFFALKIGTSPMVQPTVCEDGWESDSIGKRGACSWHGGVGTNWSALGTTFVSLLGGFGVWRVIESKNERDQERARKKAERDHQAFLDRMKAQAKAEGNDCPKCGHPMLPKLVTKGKEKGKWFRGCSRHPHCDGVTSI